MIVHIRCAATVPIEMTAIANDYDERNEPQ